MSDLTATQLIARVRADTGDAKSDLQGVSAAMSGVGAAAVASSPQIDNLTQKISFQERQLGIYQQQLAAATKAHGEGSLQVQKLQLTIDKLTTTIANNEAQIEAEKNGLQSLGAALDDTGTKADGAGTKSSRFGEVWIGIQRDLGGQVLGALKAVGDEVLQLGGEALTAYASNERLAASLQSLVAKEVQHADSTKSMAQAMDAAGPKAQELLKWTQQLAVNSPFSQDGVAAAFRQAQAYGFVSDSADKTDITAKRLTQSLIDFSSGTGQNEGSMNRIALALGQIQAKGKLAGGEMLQLTEAGLNVRQILADAMGKSTEEVIKLQEKGLIPANTAIKAIVESLEKDFGGAAQRQAGTMQGLLNSLDDLKQVGLREFFTGTFQAAQPYVQQFVDTLSSPEAQAQIRSLGDAIGKELGQALPVLADGLKQGAQYLPELVKSVKDGVQPVRDLATVLGAAYQVTEPWIGRIEALSSKLHDLSGGVTSVLNPLNLLMGPGNSVLQLLTGQEDGLHAVAEGWRGQQAAIGDSTKQQLEHNTSLQTATTALDVYGKATDGAKAQAKAQADELTSLKTAQEQAIATLNQHTASYERLGALSGYTQQSIQNEKDAIGNRTQFIDRATSALKDHMAASIGDANEMRNSRIAQTDHAQAVKISAEEIEKLQKKLEQIGTQGTQAYDKLIQSAVTFQEKSQEAAGQHQDKLNDIEADGAQKLQALDSTTADKRSDQARSYHDKVADLQQNAARKATADAATHQDDLEKLARDHADKLGDIAKKGADEAQAFRESQAEKTQTFQAAQSERADAFARQQTERAQAFRIQDAQAAENHNQKLTDLESTRAEQAQSAQAALNTKLGDLQTGYNAQVEQAAQQLQDKLRNAEESFNDQRLQSADSLHDKLRDMDEALSDARQKAADAAVDRQEKLSQKIEDLRSKSDEQTLTNKSKYDEQTADKTGKHNDTLADLDRKRVGVKTETEAALLRQQSANENQRFADEQRRAAAAFAQQQADLAKKLAAEEAQAQKEKARADQDAAESLARQVQKAARERAEAEQDAAEKLQRLKERYERERQETIQAASREDTRRQQQLQKDIQTEQQANAQKLVQIQQNYEQAKAKEEAEYTRAEQRRQQAYDRERQQQQAQFARQQADAAADATKQAAADERTFAQAKAKLDQSVTDENASYTQRQADAATHYQKTLADQASKLAEQLSDAKDAYGQQQDELQRNYDKQRDQQAQALQDRAEAEDKSYQEATRKRAQEYAKQQQDLNQALGKSLIAYVDNQKSQGKLSGEAADTLTATLRQKYGVRQGVEDAAYQKSTAALDAYIKSGTPNVQGLQRALDDTTQAAVNQQNVFDQKLKLSVDDVGQKFQDKKGSVEAFTQALRDAGSAATTTLALGQQLQNVAQSNDRAGERAGGTMPTQTATPTPAPTQAAPDTRPKTPDGRPYNAGRPASVPAGTPYFQNNQNVSRDTLVFAYNGGASYQDVGPGSAIPVGGDYKGYRRFGGAVEAHQRYLIGENGPEAFIPTQNGTVASNTQLQSLLNGGGTAQMQQAITRLTDTVRMLATTDRATSGPSRGGGDTYVFQVGTVIGETPEAFFERCRRYLIQIKQQTGKDPLGR